MTWKLGMQCMGDYPSWIFQWARDRLSGLQRIGLGCKAEVACHCQRTISCPSQVDSVSIMHSNGFVCSMPEKSPSQTQIGNGFLMAKTES